MNATDVKAKCSIRGRVAFVLAIAEQCIEHLHYSDKVYELAAKAIEDAWKWEEGGQINGEHLDYYLENEEEESLAVYGCNPPERAFGAIMAVTSAVAYVTRQAYKKDGITRMSSTIHEVSESVVDDVVESALKSPGFNPAFIDCMATYLVEVCAGLHVNDLGAPIEKQAVLNACEKDMGQIWPERRRGAFFILGW